MRRLALPAEESVTTKPRRVQGGEATARVVVSASVAGNAEVFADVAALHIPAGASVADITYGQGVFWKHVPVGRYDLLFSDLNAKVTLDHIHAVPVETGIDSR